MPRTKLTESKSATLSQSETAYVLLFRGVGGATQLPVARLKEALSQAGLRNVGTYINSGNAYFSTHWSRAEILQRVAALCALEFGFRKEIYPLTLDEWRSLVRNNPFAEVAFEKKFLHAFVLAQKPKPAQLLKLSHYAVPGERFEVVNQVAYLHTPHGFGASKLAQKFDLGLGVPNTARNWNSVLKLLERLEAIAPGG